MVETIANATITNIRSPLGPLNSMLGPYAGLPGTLDVTI